MRMTFGALAVMCYAALGMSQSPTGLDTPLRNVRVPAAPKPCEAHAIAQAIERAGQIPLGFEDLPECTAETYPGKVWEGAQRLVSLPAHDTTVLDGLSVRSALDWLTKTTPAIEWRDIDGIPNIRPKDAWNGPDDLLNLPLAPLQASALDFNGAVMELFFGVPASGLIAPQFQFDLTFAGGRVVDGLNTIIRSAHAAGWDAITIAHPTDWHESNPVAVVGIRQSFGNSAPGSNFVLSADSLAKRH